MNRPTKQKNKGEKGGVDESLERQVFKTLIENGHIIPETETEVRSAEERLAKSNKPLPEKLRDARNVLARIRSKATASGEKIVSLPQNQFAEAATELARAARKGADIPLSIEEKMRRNRAKADAETDRKSEAK
jgi:hypothetical protein